MEVENNGKRVYSSSETRSLDALMLSRQDLGFQEKLSLEVQMGWIIEDQAVYGDGEQQIKCRLELHQSLVKNR